MTNFEKYGIWIVLIIVIVIALGVFLYIQSQTEPPEFRVFGTVKDSVTGQPIEGSSVSDYNYGRKPYKSAVTNAQGGYEYLTWRDEHGIIAQAPHYKPQQKGVGSFLQSAKEQELNFELEPEN